MYVCMYVYIYIYTYTAQSLEGAPPSPPTKHPAGGFILCYIYLRFIYLCTLMYLFM